MLSACRKKGQAEAGPKVVREVLVRFIVVNVGRWFPEIKAKKITGRITLVEPTLAKELKAQGAYIAPSTDVKFYCVSCAVHRGVVKVRSEVDRRSTGRLR